MTKMAFVVFGRIIGRMAKTTATTCREMAIVCFLQLISHDPPLVLERVAKKKVCSSAPVNLDIHSYANLCK